MTNAVSPGTLTPAVTPPLKNPLVAWRTHFIIYLVVCTLLAALDYATGEPWWVHYVAAGWGVGIIGHLAGALLKRKSAEV